MLCTYFWRCRIINRCIKTYLICGVLGAVIYIVFRDSLLLSEIENNIEWFRKLRELLRMDVRGPIGYFIKYLLGDALYAYANGWVLGYTSNNKKKACFYACSISCSIEILQGLRVIYGVFDVGDVAVSLIFATIGVLTTELNERIEIRKAYTEIVEKE